MADETTHKDALVMVILRQVFYLQQLRLILCAFLLNLLLIGVLLGMLTYFLKHPVHPIYFPTDKIGRLMVEPPLNQPNMSTEDITNWVTKAVQAAYSYDFVNYRKEFQDAQRYFTDYGWKQYMKGLQASNNLLALSEHKMIISAKVVDKPKILIKGIMGGYYAWKFEMPVLVTYWQPPYDEKNRFSNPLQVTVTVIRQKLLESDHGVGIVQIVANLVISPQQQTMLTPGGA